MKADSHTMYEAEFMPTMYVDVPCAALRKGEFAIVYCWSSALVIIGFWSELGPIKFNDDIALKIIAYWVTIIHSNSPTLSWHKLIQ